MEEGKEEKSTKGKEEIDRTMEFVRKFVLCLFPRIKYRTLFPRIKTGILFPRVHCLKELYSE